MLFVEPLPLKKPAGLNFRHDLTGGRKKSLRTYPSRKSLDIGAERCQTFFRPRLTKPWTGIPWGIRTHGGPDGSAETGAGKLGASRDLTVVEEGWSTTGGPADGPGSAGCGTGTSGGGFLRRLFFLVDLF